MNNKLKMLAASLMVCAAAHADEGMWTLYNLPQAVYEQMKAEGFTMPYDELYKSNNALKNAVVNFSGFCTGVVVSPDGLVFTNHHCGFEAIRSHSTVEHDYMLNGFFAKSFAEELPNENMFVSFMVEQQDVTPKLKQMGFDVMSNSRRSLLVDSLQQAMTDSIKKIDKTLHVNIDAYYEGNKYYATTYQDFTDLRLVFTIPKSMGKFGGETDNWMWPRQTCDFSVFRIYADPKTGGPAAYSKDNVPYHPKRWAKVSLDGYKQGDYAMTVGYPGSTERYLSSYGIKEMRYAQNTTRVQVRTIKQDIMLRHMRASEAVRIKYDSKFAQSANYWKNSMGMNKCIDSIGIIAQKQAFEKQLQVWQDSTGYLKGKLDFNKLVRYYAKRMGAMRPYYFFIESFRRNNEFVTRAMMQTGGMEVKGPENKPAKQYLQFKDNSNEWDEATDKEVFAAMLKNYKEQVNKKYLPKFYTTINDKFGGDYAKYVDYLYKNSLLMKKGAKLYFHKKNYKNDPGVQLGNDLMNVLTDLREDLAKVNDSIDIQERYLCDAKVRMEQDMPHYSDANFTMRLSYGQVGGFDLGGKDSGYYTTAESLLEKMKKGDKVVDYFAEPVMHVLMSAKDY